MNRWRRWERFPLSAAAVGGGSLVVAQPDDGRIRPQKPKRTGILKLEGTHRKARARFECALRSRRCNGIGDENCYVGLLSHVHKWGEVFGGCREYSRRLCGALRDCRQSFVNRGDDISIAFSGNGPHCEYTDRTIIYINGCTTHTRVGNPVSSSCFPPQSRPASIRASECRA